MTKDGYWVPLTDSFYDIGTNSVRVRNGYFDTLYGDGSNLTGITGTTINGNTDHYVVTATGTANTLQGESTLTYNGNQLNVIQTTSSSDSKVVIANSNTPLLVAMDVSVLSEFSFLIVFASTVATASVFLALLPAISRIYVAMSRDNILPSVFSKIHKKNNSAYIAEVFVLLTVVIGIYTLNITNAIKMSAFFILIYYALTNLSVIRLKKSERLYSVFIAQYGLVMCLALAITLVLF